MSRERIVSALIALAIAIASLAPPAGAATSKPRPRATPPAAKTRPGPRPASTTTPAVKPATPRTLDAVHIEGQLDVPEVLFITARDQRRVVDFQHGRYLAGSRELARRTPLPTRILVLYADTTAVTPAQGSTR